MTKPICLACRTCPGVTITNDGWTPLCDACLERLGTPLMVGRRAVCHIGSIHGSVVRFDDSAWAKSGLAVLAHDDGTTGWYPLAELAPGA